MADNDVSKLRVALSKVSEYTKSAAGKQLPVVVRISQDSKKASWKPGNAPNWWVEGRRVEESNIDGTVPAFGPVKNMKIDGIKAALAAFYLARIHFEERVRSNADDTILEESADGKNPFNPEHYAGDDYADEEVDDGDEGAEGVVNEEEMEDEQPENEEELKIEDDDEGKQEGDGDDDDAGHEEYNVKELKRLVANMKRDNTCTEMFEVLREKLLSVVAEEKERDEWTVHDEEYKLTLGYHTCCAKLMVDVEALKREEDARFEAYSAELMVQCEKDMSRIPKNLSKLPVEQVKQKQLDDVLARLEARKALTQVPIEIEDDNNDDTTKRPRRPRTRSSVSVVDFDKDADEDVDIEAGFATPVVDPHKMRVAAAASRSIRKGTPLRNLKEDDIETDDDGNVISLFTANGSPVIVNVAAIQRAKTISGRPRRNRGANSKPPPTPAAVASPAASRRSKRNKR